jgi:hypothetical protein
VKGLTIGQRVVQIDHNLRSQLIRRLKIGDNMFCPTLNRFSNLKPKLGLKRIDEPHPFNN